MTDMEDWTVPYGLIDSDHPSVVSAVAKATPGCATDEEKAVAIHDFVRDHIRFGFSPQFDNLPASVVLQHGRGFCNPKSTLFVAMLRAAGIPARQHMVSINMNVLYGLGTPTRIYGDHAISEVYLNNRWLLVDSYTVDTQLYMAAKQALRLEGRIMGYGVHENGVVRWDGKLNSFVQYVVQHVDVQAMPGEGRHSQFSGAEAKADGPMSDRDFGVVRDVREFLERVQGSPFAWLRSGFGRLWFGVVGARYCNRMISLVRRSAGSVGVENQS